MKTNRGERRKTDYNHAIRKRNIARNYILGEEYPWYNNLHQYSKNKVHCSCPLCRAKSYDEDTIADKRKKERMRSQENEIV